MTILIFNRDNWQNCKELRTNGLYYLIAKDEIVYIGRARNVLHRFNMYFISTTIRFVQPHIVPGKITRMVVDTEGYENEVEEIEKFKPKWNISNNDEFKPHDLVYCTFCRKRHNPNDDECEDNVSSSIFKQFYKNRK